MTANVKQSDEEKEILVEIKNQINSLINKRIIEKKIRQGEFVNRAEIEVQAEQDFFDSVGKHLEEAVSETELFFKQLKIDNVRFFELLEQKFISQAKQTGEIKTFHDLLKLNIENLLTPKEIQELYSLGLDWFHQEQFQKAYLYFVFLSLTDSKNSEMWFVRGMAEQNLGKYREALASYHHTIELDPSHILPYIQVIDTLLLSQLWEQAYQAYQSFIKEIEPSLYKKNDFILSKLSTIKEFLEDEGYEVSL